MLYIVGYPSSIGGADTELWHLLRIARQRDYPITLIPTWRASPEWRIRCDEIGAITREVDGPSRLEDVEGLAGSTVLSFCNGEFLRHATLFRELKCRIIWVNCMNWVFPAERDFYQRFGAFDEYVFQSAYQQSLLYRELAEFGVAESQCHLIHGMFDVDEFPFCPLSHEAETDFVIGRLARPDLDKWNSALWRIYGSVPYERRRARIMGWSHQLARKLGPPPDWAEALAPCAEPSHHFIKSLHCVVSANGGASENWPRVGLEAMSTGVPIVAENKWGWREMIVHGETGFLADSDDQLAHYAGQLATNEELRQRVIKNARERLTAELAEPTAAWDHWLRVLEPPPLRFRNQPTLRPDRTTSLPEHN